MKTTWLAGLGVLILVGCAGTGGGDVVESTYTDGMYNGTAVLKPKANGGYQTISGDPVIAVDNGLTTASQLPYGDSNSGIREAQDAAGPAGF